jgi:GNAT superfamily N-acetyltransferase
MSSNGTRMSPASTPTAPAAEDGRAVLPEVGSVRLLAPEELDTAAEMLARGFAAEPGNLALYPDPEVRRTILEAGARTYLRSTIRLGTALGVEVGGQLGALALWHPPGVPSTSLADLVQLGRDKLGIAPTVVRAVPGAALRALRQPPTALRLVRARGRAVRAASQGLTWHLAFLATAPEHRGRGLARQLLDRQLARCDEDGLAAWLETTDPVNPPIYERFGFRTVAHVPDADAAWLPGWWAMRREPAGP